MVIQQTGSRLICEKVIPKIVRIQSGIEGGKKSTTVEELFREV